MRRMARLNGLPCLLTAEETALLLCPTRKAVYEIAERGQPPRVTRIGRTEEMTP